MRNQSRNCVKVSKFQLRAIKHEQNKTIDAFMTKAGIITNDYEYTDKDEQFMDTLIAGIYTMIAYDGN